MKCPKCGYIRQSRDDAFVPATECPSCGIVYAKHETIAAPPPHLRPSAVDSESLKRARDRVEKRLRKRLETRVRDDRHDQTLELARRIANDNAQEGQELILPALGQDSPTEAPTADAEQEDPMLLDEVVGVQSHPGHNDAPANERVTEEDLDELHAEETPAEASAEPEPATEVADQQNYPSDVRVETVLLTSQPENLDKPCQEEAETEPTATKEVFEAPDEKLPEACIEAASTAAGFGAKLTRLLPMAAWLILIIGLVGSVLSWTTITDVEAGVNAPVDTNSSDLFPLGLLLGFAYLAIGALGFAFFWVSSMINRQLKDIRQLIVLHTGEVDSEDRPDKQKEWS